MILSDGSPAPARHFAHEVTKACKSHLCCSSYLPRSNLYAVSVTLLAIVIIVSTQRWVCLNMGCTRIGQC